MWARHRHGTAPRRHRLALRVGLHLRGGAAEARTGAMPGGVARMLASTISVGGAARHFSYRCNGTRSISCCVCCLPHRPLLCYCYYRSAAATLLREPALLPDRPRARRAPQPVADRTALLDCGVHPAGRVVAEGGEHLFTAGGVKRRRPQKSRYRLRAAEARRTACNCSQPRGSGRSRLRGRGCALSRPVDDQSGPRTWPRLPTRGRAAPLR